MTQLFEAPSESQKVVGYAQVVLEQGIDSTPDGLTYAIGPSLENLRVGDRVIVPLGARDRPTSGYVTGLSTTSDLPQVKFIRGRDPGSVSLTADLIELARWMGAYYCCPLGMVYATMLPGAVKRGRGMVTRTRVRLVARPGDEGIKITKLQRAVIESAEALAAEGEPWIEIKRLADRARARSISPVKQLVKKGVLSTQQHTSLHAELYEHPSRPDTTVTEPIRLSTAQEKAVRQLASGLESGFSVHLLHGVTGSGKTEVYIRAIGHLLGGGTGVMDDGGTGPGAIVLVPEIALTPQTVGRFQSRFEGVAVLHSGLSDAERHAQWRRVREGRARIVVGARSAIFAPLPRVGLIVVDEEHEPNYKQDQLPRYHARDVAIKRAQILGIPVVLGSATPSLESYYNATDVSDGRCFGESSVAGRPLQHQHETCGPQPASHHRPRPGYHLIHLPDRVTGLKLPKVQIIDMVEERRHRRGVHLISRRLEDLLRYTFRQKGQAILLLNRRGYANYIACPDHGCGWLMNCEYCDATMVYHKDHRLPAGGLVRCHHCSAEQLLPKLCPVCQKKVTVFGLGTQRVEEEVGRKLKHARVLRMDSDTMRTGRDYHDSLEAFRRCEIDLLLGTQMIAKGLDFPNVRLVGVISADTALHLPDFRASERTFQMIAQVAGRAGRGQQPGIVVVQTFSPNDVAITFAARHDYESFVHREIALRAEVGLPPVTRLARIVIRHRDNVACGELAAKLAQHLDVFNRHLEGRVQLRGPMPCPIARIAGFYRIQIEMVAPNAAAIQRLMTALRNARLLQADGRTAVDVDPVAML